MWIRLLARWASPWLFFVYLSYGLCAQEPPKKGPKENDPAVPNLVQTKEILYRDGIKHPYLRKYSQHGDAGELPSSDEQGLRIALPANRENLGDIGVECLHRLRGDFEITLEYDLISVPNPAPDLGAGAVLQIVLDTPDTFRARMGRSRKKTKSTFGANYITKKTDGKDDFRGIVALPANENLTKGRLRMVRAATTLRYLVAEGAGEFKEIARKDVPQADVVSVQASCATGWQPVAFEVRFPRLELRATSIDEPAGAEPLKVTKVDNVSEAERPHYFLYLGLALTVFVAAFAAVGVMRRRIPRTAASAPPFDCPRCQKKLKIPADSMGKKVRCPQCGNVSVIE